MRFGRSLISIALLAAALAVTAVQPAAAAGRPLTFGIYTGGYAGGGSTNGKPDDVGRIVQALDTLQGRQHHFLVREYVDCGSAPDQFRPLLGHGRRLDLVLVSTPGQSLADWETCVRDTVHAFGPLTSTLSVTLEANIQPTPDVEQQLVQGVITARQEARRAGDWWLQVGFDEVAFGRPSTAFWQDLARLGGARFARSVDYVGVDMYPDVPFPGVPSRPVDLPTAVTAILKVVREQEMPVAGLAPWVPIRVAENGWATSATRTPEQQEQALRTEITTVAADSAAYGVASYELFDLRDDVTGSPNIFDQFGIMDDDYTPKPMFATYRSLVRSLGR